MESILAWISTYGYAAIFLLLMLGIVGLPVPDETLLVFCGYLVSSGRLHPAAIFATAVAGSCCGISISYVIGRTLGMGAVHRYGKPLHVTEERLATIHEWFDKFGHWSLFFGYFIAGVRHVTAIVAGTSNLEYRSFAAYAYSGAAVWAASFLTLGYFVGENWREIAESLHRYILYVSVVVVVAAVAVFLWRKRKKA
ncbi:MAG: DedA family protein [Bryobacterales bacterium]|nr:DedA family protein [Bryobacterales bacterium]MBV9400757.1 DedA family protein [Bryobacterales bacterium]